MESGKDNKYSKLAEEIILYICKRLSGKMNYLTPLIYSLTPFPVKANEPLATDGKYLFFNPGYVIETYKSNPGKLQSEYMHIISHCILGHVFKRRGTHEMIFDAASDLSAAAFIAGMGVRGVSKKLDLSDFTDRRIIDKIIKSRGITGFYEYLCHNGQLCDEVMKAGEKLYTDNHYYWNHLHPELAEKFKSDGHLGNGANNINRWYRQYQLDNKQAWDRLLFLTGKNGDSEGFIRIWGKDAGNFIKDFSMSPENNISYKDFLHRFMVLSEKQKIDPDSFDYAWYTIGLKQYNNIPLIETLESCEEMAADDLIIALDTSGSCIDTMNRFLRESYNILSDMNIDSKVNIRIIQCDTKVRDDRIIQSKDDLPDFEHGYKIKGFGGTSFCPVFDYIEKLIQSGEVKRVGGLLYFSDGYGDFPKHPPEYETAFIFPPGCPDNDNIPNWITKVRLTNEDILY